MIREVVDLGAAKNEDAIWMQLLRPARQREAGLLDPRNVDGPGQPRVSGHGGDRQLGSLEQLTHREHVAPARHSVLGVLVGYHGVHRLGVGRVE